MFGPLYYLLELKLQAFNEYFKANFAKKFIQLFSLPVKYLILFILKKNGKLRLYINYRKLNEITMKNRYPLFNVNELRDRL